MYSVFFSGPPPKKLEYKIALYPLALREISDQLTWVLYSNFLGGARKKKKKPVEGVQVNKSPSLTADCHYNEGVL